MYHAHSTLFLADKNYIAINVLYKQSVLHES